MIQSRRVAGVVLVYAAVSAGFAVFWLVGVPLSPRTSLGWVLLFIGALPASLAIEFVGSRMLGAVDHASGARRRNAWISRTLLAASLVAIAAVGMWVSTIVRSA